MRIAGLLLASLLLSTPMFAQTPPDDQEHSGHHPGATEESVAAPPAVSPQNGPAAQGMAASRTTPGAAGSMECSMMPGMMQSMMKGMMQGMMSSGQATPPGGMTGMGGMASGGGPGQGRTSTPAASDQSLPAITLRAVTERTRNSLGNAGQGGDAEFVRVAIVLQEALLDSAKAVAAFGNSLEIRQKAQTLLAANEAQLASLKAWAASLK